MRKQFLVIVLSLVVGLTLCACGPSSDGANSNSEKTVTEEVTTEDTSTPEKPDRDLPEGNYEDVGEGTLYLVNESGSTENGDSIVVYPSMDAYPFAYVDYELWDLDGSVLTYIYLDGVQIDKQQIGAGYQSSLILEKEWQVTEGEHRVEAVQYADNDPSGEITFYRSEVFNVSIV